MQTRLSVYASMPFLVDNVVDGLYPRDGVMDNSLVSVNFNIKFSYKML